MKIDGYVAPAHDVALEQGVSFTYPTPYGEVVIRSKLAGRENAQFRIAMQNHSQWASRRRSLTKGQDDEAENRLIGLLFDHLVISWSTTIKSEGKAIEPTRANFVELLKSPATKGILPLYIEDAGEEDHFRAETAEEVGNASQEPSDGNSDGGKRRTGS